MYQSTGQATSTRYQTRPQPQTYTLAGRQVARELYEAKERAKRDGRRVLLVPLTIHGDEMDVPPGVCVNCLGAEYIGIEVLVAGPFRDAPGGQSNEGGGPALRPAWHNKAWWQVARQFAPCPICGPRVIQL